jgi:hypothetical protein
MKGVDSLNGGGRASHPQQVWPNVPSSLKVRKKKAISNLLSMFTSSP